MTETKAVLNQLNIVAANYAAMIEFYRRLGAEIPEGVTSPEGFRHAGVTFPNGMLLEIDNYKLAKIYNAGWRGPQRSNPITIGFSLPTRNAVDEKYTELIDAGFKGRQPPYDAFWGARYAIVADPDGNDVGLMSPIDEGQRSWPPTESPAPSE
jgi:uncharacterized glyoxalase superfamily protein PhnB